MSTHESAPHSADSGEMQWGDYNSQPLGPSNLPPLEPLALATLGLSLAVLLAGLFTASMAIDRTSQAGPAAHTPARETD